MTSLNDICFTIEGVGRLTDDINRLYYFSKGPAPSWDTDEVWVRAVQGFPGENGSTVDFARGETTIGARRIVVGSGYTTQQGRSVGSLFYDQTRVQVASATAELVNPGSTPITLDRTDIPDGTNVTWGREVMRITSHLGGGQYAVQRGRLGTLAVPHPVGPTDHTGVLDADRVPVLRWRRMTFYHKPMGAASYDDLEAFWAGFISNVEASSPETIRFDAYSLFHILRDMQVCRNLWRSDPRLPTNLGTSGTVRQYAGKGAPARTSPADISLDEKLLVRSDYSTTAGTTTVTVEPSDVATICEGRTIPDDVDRVWECFHCNGDDTDTGSLPLSSNVVTLALQLLTTTPGGQNGPYDVGVEDLGCGVDIDLVNVAAFEDVRARYGDLLFQDRLVLGFDGNAVGVYDWLVAKLLPYGIALIDTGTQIGLVGLQDNATLVTAQLREREEILGPASIPRRDPPFQRRRVDMDLDEATVRWGYVPGTGPNSTTFTSAARRGINLYGGNQNRTYDLYGVGSEAIAELITAAQVQRFHDTIPEIRLSAKRGTCPAPGELVLVTHSKIYGAFGGVRGVTAAPMLVTHRIAWMDQNVEEVRLLDVGALYGRVGVIAPSGVVESWASGTGTLILKPDLSGGGFQSGDTATAPKDVSDFEVGDIVDLRDSTGVVRVAGLEIATLNTSTNSMTFTVAPDTGGSPVTPVAGDVLRVSDYDRSIERQKNRYAYISNSDGQLGAFNVDGQEYTQ